MTNLSDAARIAALARSNKPMNDAFKERVSFAGRSLSDRLIDALVACGMDAPERLLFMDAADLKKIPGVGKKTLAEIEAYRRRFLE